MSEDPLVILAFFGIGIYLAGLWTADYRAQCSNKQTGVLPLPGAFPASASAIHLAIIGALVLVSVETLGEYSLGIAQEQTTIPGIFLLAMIAASIAEEVLFRGFLVVKNHGKLALVLSIFGFSLLFAVLHPYIWTYHNETASWRLWEGQWQWNLTTKGIFSTLILFLNSLWFYAVRFMPLNPKHSLLPCFAAHLSSNLAVFVVKLLTGHVSGIF